MPQPGCRTFKFECAIIRLVKNNGIREKWRGSRLRGNVSSSVYAVGYCSYASHFAIMPTDSARVAGLSRKILCVAGTREIRLCGARGFTLRLCHVLRPDRFQRNCRSVFFSPNQNDSIAFALVSDKREAAEIIADAGWMSDHHRLGVSATRAIYASLHLGFQVPGDSDRFICPDVSGRSVPAIRPVLGDESSLFND
jgi:hypothetical protein